MAGPNPKFDTVLVVTDEDLRLLKSVDGTTQKTVDGNTYTLTSNTAEVKRAPNGLYVSSLDKQTLREGGAVNYSGHDVSVMHEDYAGTPKPREEIAERMFETFKEVDGPAKNVAQETLHLLGYEVEKDVSYRLVDKRNA
jgi:hypothetical protein